MRFSKWLLPLALFCAPTLAFAGQVPNPINAPASSTAGHFLTVHSNNGQQSDDSGISIAGVQYTVGTVALFSTDTHVSSFTKVATAGYYTAGDGLGGVYSKISGSCTADAGYCLHDVSGNSWTLDGFDGHPSLRAYGCRSTDSDCSTKITALLAIASTRHLPRVYQDNAQLKFTGSLTPPANTTWDCGGTGGQYNGATNIALLAGVIYADPGTPSASTGNKIDLSADRAYVENCHIVNPEPLVLGRVNTNVSMRIANQNFNGTAVYIGGRSSGIKNSTIAGYTYCVDAESTSAPVVQDVYGHCTNGIKGISWHSGGQIRNFRMVQLLFANNSNLEVSWNIDSIISSSGACEYVFASDTTLVEGDTIFPTLTGNGCSQTGPITAHVLDARHIVGVGTSYGSVATTGTWETGSYVLTLASTTNLAVGQTLTGYSAIGIPDGSIVASVGWPSNGECSCVVLDRVTTIAQASAQALSFANPAYASGGILYVDAAYSQAISCI
jgi:hypothetical protein